MYNCYNVETNVNMFTSGKLLNDAGICEIVNIFRLGRPVNSSCVIIESAVKLSPSTSNALCVTNVKLPMKNICVCDRYTTV